MIRLEPIATEPCIHESMLGRPTLGTEGDQKIRFSVRAPKVRYGTWTETLLATGEKLEELEGSITIHRGLHTHDDGTLLPNALFYIPAVAENIDSGATKSGFEVQLFLSTSAFDQLLQACLHSILPVVNLEFDFISGPIKYARGSDGSEMRWDNRGEGQMALVTGATLTTFFAPSSK